MGFSAARSEALRSLIPAPVAVGLLEFAHKVEDEAGSGHVAHDSPEYPQGGCAAP